MEMHRRFLRGGAMRRFETFFLGRHGTYRLFVVVVVALFTAVLVTVSAGATPSSFIELDGNVVFNGTGTFDWANSGALSTTGNTYSRAGSGGIFDGGHFNG